MTHSDAIAGGMVEKYLLGDLSAAERDAFEEHFFECRECAEEVEVTSRFIEQIRARGMAAAMPAAVMAPPPGKQRPWFSVAPMGLAASLAFVVGYQNLVQLPALRAVAARPALQGAPVSLRMGERSESETPVIVRRNGKPLLFHLDIPVEERFTGYDVALSGPLAAVFAVSPGEAAQPLIVNFGTSPPPAGRYTIVVRGKPASGEAVLVQQRTFLVE